MGNPKKTDHVGRIVTAAELSVLDIESNIVIASSDPAIESAVIPLHDYVIQASDFAVLPRHVATGETYREWARKLSSNGAAVCLVVCPEKKKFLLDLRGEHVQHPGTYGLPGGALEDDETPTAGALRELYEETGKRIRKADSVIKLANGLWCVVVTVPKLFTPRISNESAELAWYSTLPAKSKLHPAMRKSYAMYVDLIANIMGVDASYVMPSPPKRVSKQTKSEFLNKTKKPLKSAKTSTKTKSLRKVA